MGAAAAIPAAVRCIPFLLQTSVILIEHHSSWESWLTPSLPPARDPLHSQLSPPVPLLVALSVTLLEASSPNLASMYHLSTNITFPDMNCLGSTGVQRFFWLRVYRHCVCWVP